MKNVMACLFQAGCLAVAVLAMLAVCSCLETLIFQTVFRFLRFDGRLVFGFFMAVQSIELAVTGGKGWF